MLRAARRRRSIVRSLSQQLVSGKRLRRRRSGSGSAAHDVAGGVETCEDRTLLTTTLFLDFGAGFFGSTIATTVQGFRDIDGPATFGTGSNLAGRAGLVNSSDLTFQPLDYDYDGNGVFELADVTAMSDAVTRIAEDMVSPYDIDVQIAAATSFDDVVDAMQANDAGMPDADGFGENDAYVFVADVTSARFGGGSVGDNAGLFGIAAANDLFLQAGNNTDEAALTFSDTIFGSTAGSSPIIFNNNLVHRLAYTAVHEAGHTLQLIHSDGSNSGGGERTLTRGDGIRVGSDTRETRNVFHRFDFELQGSSRQGNNYDLMASDPDIGLKDSDRDGVPDFAYVTGTGAFDRITITNAGSDTATVLVEAFEDPEFTSAIRSASYDIDLLTDTEGAIVVDASISNDLVIIDTDINADFRIRGHIGSDTLQLTGSAADFVVHTIDAGGEHTLQVSRGAAVSTISYDTELELIDSAIVSAATSVLSSGGNQTLQVFDAGGGRTQVVSNIGPSVTFVNPTANFTITGDTGTDTVVIADSLNLPGDLEVSAQTIQLAGASLETDGAQTYNSPVRLSNSMTLTGSAVTFNDTVDAALADSNRSVGLTDNSAGGGYRSFSSDLRFTVTSTVTLDEVFVYADAAGDVKVDLLDGSGETLLQSKSFPITTADIETKTAIPLNLTLAPGSYRLHSDAQSTPQLFRNSAGVGFPYTNGPVSITGSTSNGFYYWFYDWQFTSASTTAASVDLVVDTTGSGLTQFNGVVGGIAALSSITTNADGTTQIAADLTTDGSTMTFNDDVELTSAVTLTDTGATGIQFAGDVVPNRHLATVDADTVTFIGGSGYNFRVESATAGLGGHDQLAIEGSLALGTAGVGVTLAIDDNGYTAVAGDELIILVNDGTDAVIGTFAGLAEGASVGIGGATATDQLRGRHRQRCRPDCGGRRQQ